MFLYLQKRWSNAQHHDLFHASSMRACCKRARSAGAAARTCGKRRRRSAAAPLSAQSLSAWAGPCRAQTRLMAQQKGEGPVRYRGLADALLKIPREEGLRALWKGLLPRLMRIPPGQARPAAPSRAAENLFLY